METDISKMTDHDLLITMHEQIKGIKADIKDLKDGTSTTLTDHENRIRRLELWGAIAIGFSYALQFYFNIIK